MDEYEVTDSDLAEIAGLSLKDYIIWQTEFQLKKVFDDIDYYEDLAEEDPLEDSYYEFISSSRKTATHILAHLCELRALSD